MKNSSPNTTDQDECNIPLQEIPETDIQPEPDSPKQQKNTCGLCCKTFIQSTSIRGAKHTITNPHLGLRIFWILFIILSFALVFTIGSFCLSAYAQFHTVIRQNIRPVRGRDMPVVTICSDGLFSDTPAVRDFAAHPLAYDMYVTDLMQQAVKHNNFKQLKFLLRLRTMSQYNANNLEVMQRLVPDELKRELFKEFDSNVRYVPTFQCKIDEMLCKVTAFLNLRYRNCISSRVPDRLLDNKVNKIFINGLLLTMAKPPLLPPDQKTTEGLFLSTRHIHVFLHEPNTLPRWDPDFIIGVDTNRRILIDIDISHLQRIVTPRASCAVKPRNASHAGETVTITPAVCEDLAWRAKIRQECQCEAPWIPIDKWPLQNSRFCGNLSQNFEQVLADLECIWLLDNNDKPAPNECETPCSQRNYNARLNVDDFESYSLSRVTREQLLTSYVQQTAQVCKYKSKQPTKCQNMKAVLNTLLNNATIDPLTYRKRMTNSKSKDVNYWRLAFPNSTSSDFGSKVDKNFITTHFSLTVQCPKSYVLALDESLVRTIWTTLAQVGGASSFLAGFTFGVIAEVIDTIYKAFKGKKTST